MQIDPILKPAEKRTEKVSQFKTQFCRMQTQILRENLTNFANSTISFRRPLGTIMDGKKIVELLNQPYIIKIAEVIAEEKYKFWILLHIKDAIQLICLNQSMDIEKIKEKASNLTYHPEEWDRFVKLTDLFCSWVCDVCKKMEGVDTEFSPQETIFLDFSKSPVDIKIDFGEKIFLFQQELTYEKFPESHIYFIYQFELAQRIIKELVKDPVEDLMAFSSDSVFVKAEKVEEGITIEKATVLIVEDATPVRKIVSHFLREEGFYPVEAVDVYQAVDAIQRHKIDLILLDIMLPEVDGFTFCHRLKEHPDTKDIPIIFLTAKSQEKDVIRAVNLGADDYIVKPFSKKIVIDKIKFVLSQKSQE